MPRGSSTKKRRSVTDSRSRELCYLRYNCNVNGSMIAAIADIHSLVAKVQICSVFQRLLNCQKHWRLYRKVCSSCVYPGSVSKEIADPFLELSTWFNSFNNMQALSFFCEGNRQVAFQVLLKPGEMACLPAGCWVQSLARLHHNFQSITQLLRSVQHELPLHSSGSFVTTIYPKHSCKNAFRLARVLHPNSGAKLRGWGSPRCRCAAERLRIEASSSVWSSCQASWSLQSFYANSRGPDC